MTSSQELQETAADGCSHFGPVWRGPLRAPERALLECAETGDVLDLRLDAAPADDQTPLDFDAMQVWGADRTIRADVLRHLLVASQWPVHAKGVRLQGARITGTLDLESATLRCPLVLQDCYLERPVVLDYATVSRLELVRCGLAGLTADMVIVTMDLDLNRSKVTGVVRLVGARITGEFICRGAQFTGNTDGNALIGDGVTVGGTVFLDDGFTAAGAVRLPGASITGLLGCRGAQITGTDTDGNALLADWITVGGTVILDGLRAAGAVRLSGASITGQLHCSGAHITGTNTDGSALIADAVTVSADIVLNDGFTAAGAVRLHRASITGQLNCRGAQITGTNTVGDALIADAVTVGDDVLLDGGFTAAGAVRLSGAGITGLLNCSGAQIADNTDGNALIGDGVTVGGGVFLDGGFTAAGAVRLPGAGITGLLGCSGAQITGTNTDGLALVADRVTVGGAVVLDGFMAAGGVWLHGASITGQLVCRGAQITGTSTDGTALIADAVTVGGAVVLDGFMAAGAVRLPGADITGQLVCRGAQITGTNTDGDALIADAVTVGDDVLLDGGFTAAGAVRLVGASITGQLNRTSAQIVGTNTAGDALIADRITVSGGVLLNGGFTAAGAVQFSGSRLDGHLSLDDARLADPVAFVADGARIGQQFIWAPANAVTGLVSLERTQLHRLDDDWGNHEGPKEGAHWPRAGTERRLRLAGFVYDGFGGDYQATWQQRLDWIRGQHQTPVPGQSGSFDAQPYEQLARVYRQAGQDTEAREIAIARRSDLRIYGDLGRWRFAVNWLLDVTIRHGYKSLRAVVVLLVAYGLALGLFWGAQHQDGLMVPAKDTGSLHPAPTAMVCTSDYPCFSPVGYAVDVTIPIIKTGQADNWRPNAAAHWGWVYLAGTWVFTGLGWAFTTLAVAGYTGLIRKD